MGDLMCPQGQQPHPAGRVMEPPGPEPKGGKWVKGQGHQKVKTQALSSMPGL